MVRNYYVLICALFIPFLVNSQESLKDIFKINKLPNYYEITTKSDSYFRKKYPNKSAAQLSEGEFRDGEFVKYMRWKSFWKYRHTKDGKLADLSKVREDNKILRNNDENKNSLGSYGTLQWNNISYYQDLGVQIGLGRTNAIGFHPTDPNIFYVGSANGGIWKTIDGGNTYVPLGDSLPYMAISSICIDKANPNIIYIAISDRVWYGPSGIGVYKSTDGGSTWNATALTLNFSDNIRIYWMEQDPNNSNVLFVGTEDGLYHTSDGFNTVNKVANGKITDVKFKPGNSNIIYYVNQNDNTFYRSINGGVSFNQISDWGGTKYMRIVVTALNPNTVYVSQDNNLHKSTDSGASFGSTISLANAYTYDGIVMISPTDENHIYTGWFDMYKSSDGGTTYSQISHWLGNFGLPLIHVDMRNAFINPLQNDRIYLCDDGGVHTVNVNTDQFTNLSNGLVITQFFDIATSQSDPKVMSGGSQDNGNVFRESNGTWVKAAPTADGMHQEIDPTNANIRYNAVQNGVIYRFINGSKSTISENIPGTPSAEWETPFTLDQNNPNTIIAAYSEIYRSTDQGNSWTAISTSLAEGRAIDLLAVAPSNGERIYAVENYGVYTGDIFGTGHYLSKVFIKDINSNNWTTVTLPINEFVQDIVVNPNNPDNVYISLAGYTNNHKVFESTDGGMTWQNISGNSLPNVPAGAIAYYDGSLFSNPSALFIGTDNGMYFKEDTMSDWEKAGVFPNTHIMDIEIQKSNNLLRVGTHGRGILEASIDVDLGIKDIENKLVIDMYPNPSTGILNIKLPINSESYFYMIYDILGKEVIKRSKIENQINLTTINRGIYFIKVTNGNQNIVSKIVRN